MKSGTKLFLVVLWLAILGGGAFVWLYYLRGEPTDKVEQEYRAAYEQNVEEGLDAPKLDEFAKRVNKSTRPALEEKLKEINSEMDKRYPRIPLAIDNFSGYSIFRDKSFHKKLKDKSIYLRLVNDNADYNERIKGLEKGETKLAVYTIDALLNTSVLTANPPASIVMVIDESKGADAVLAFKDAIPSLSALNQDDVKMVFTKGSPSETLARVVRGSFPSPKIHTANMLPADDPPSVMKQIDEAAKVKDKTKDKRAFVLWEPDVSKMKAKYPGQLETLVDSKSDKSFGKIVDVFVAEKKFLAERPEVVQAVIKAYMDTYEELQKSKGMVQLVVADAEKTGAPMETPEARSVVEGIAWRSIQQNYDHFRIDGSVTRSMEDMIRDLNKLLIENNVYSAIKEPTRGNPASLFDKGPLQALYNDKYQPKPDTAPSAAVTNLTEVQWTKLLPVNEVNLPRIEFKTGATETQPFLAQEALEAAKAVVEKNPNYYLEIRGSAKPGTNPEEALKIAKGRAEWVAGQLKERGVPANRFRASANDNMTGDTNKRDVEFILLEKPNQ